MVQRSWLRPIGPADQYGLTWTNTNGLIAFGMSALEKGDFLYQNVGRRRSERKSQKHKDHVLNNLIRSYCCAYVTPPPPPQLNIALIIIRRTQLLLLLVRSVSGL